VQVASSSQAQVAELNRVPSGQHMPYEAVLAQMKN
jgi:hypothetical protein